MSDPHKDKPEPTEAPAGTDELAEGRRRWWQLWRRRRRKISRRLVVTLFTINAGVVGAVIYMFSYDPGITPEIEAYFEPPPVSGLEHNGWAALAGLDAPPDEDMVSFGIAKLRSYLDEDVPRPEYTPQRIKSIDLSRMECWYMPYMEDAKRSCLPGDELENVLERNALMMRRYERLYNFPVFDVLPQTEFKAAAVNTLRELHKLQMARIGHLEATGRVEEALDLWIREMHFQRNMSLSQMTALDMIQRLEMLERSARLLPHIIRGRPELVRENYDDLLAVVAPPGRDLWPFSDTLRNEGILWVRRVRSGAKRFTTDDGRVLYRPVKINIFKRKYYKYAQSLERAYDYPTGEGVQMAIAAVQKDYNTSLFRGMEDFASPAQSIISNYMMSNLVSMAHLLGRVLQREDLLRMMTIFIMAEARDTPPGKMPEFLQNMPEDLHSNMTGEPYRWDAEQKMIYSEYYDRLLAKDIRNYVRIGTSPRL